MSITGKKKKKTIRKCNIWRLNNTLLNNQQITEEIKKEIKICIEMNENESTTTQNLFSSVQFSRSVVSNSLQHHESQHTRPPCPSPTPAVHKTIHLVGDAIQTSHPLLSPSPPAPNPSQHQSLFQWVNSSHEVAKVLEFQLWPQSFQRTPRTDLL